MGLARPCIDCGALIPSGSRCAGCQATSARDRPSSRQRGYTAAYERLRKKVLADQPWCSECGTAGDERNPLEVDHVMPLSRGGTNELANLRTCCRRCNGSKSNKLPPL